MVRLLLAERGLDARQLDLGVRFRAYLGQSFPAHEARVVGGVGTFDEALAPVAVEMRNFTLAGILGPLPEALVDQLMARRRDGDGVWATFLDVFNHRLNALRYRLKSQTRVALDLLAPDQTDVAQMYLALTGLAESAAVEQLPFSPRSWVGVAGLLANRRRSAPVVCRVLARWTAAPVQVQPLTGSWRSISPSAWTRLGIQGSSQILGATAHAGTTAWLPAAAIQLTIGPLSYAAYCSFLPASAPGARTKHEALCWIVRLLLNWRQDAKVILLLADDEKVQEELRGRLLSEVGKGSRIGVRLGQTAWLGGKAHRARQTCFRVHALQGSQT